MSILHPYRSRTWAVLLAAVLGCLAFAVPAPGAQHGRQVWTVDSADRVFSSSPQADGARRGIALYAARGEQESAQIAVRAAGADATGVHVLPATLHGPHGTALPAGATTVRQEYNHPNVVKVDGDVQQPPDGGHSYYDALVENRPSTVRADTTQPYLYSVRVPRDQKPGTYRGSATVVGSSGPTRVPVSLTVYDAAVPPTDRSSFQMNNWFTSAGWDYKGTVQAIPKQYGVRRYDRNWWRVIGNIARNMARHRNNVVYADFQALLIPHTTIGADGSYHFDWRDFDRFVQLFVDAGAMQYIFTPTLLEPDPSGTPNLEMLAEVDGKTKRVLVKPDTRQANAYLDALFPALRKHLDAKGWTKRFYMSALDEPSTRGQIDAANWFYRKYRASFPGGKYHTNEAHLRPEPGLEGDLTTVTPIIDNYERNTGYYQNRRISGVDLWLYNCIGPMGEEMNRFISYHLDKTRLTPWLVWKIGGSGYLHWGWNMWFDSPSGPFEKIDTFTAPQTGDNYLVRPDARHYDVYDSLRSEAQLDGLEDYELLHALAKTRPLAARAIAQRVITNARSYTRSGQEVVDAHKAVLDALVGGADEGPAPFRDSFAGGDGAWVHTSGDWRAGASGYTQTDVAARGAVSAVRAPAWGDANVSTDVRIGGVDGAGGDTNWAGVVLHNLNATDIDSGYLVGIRNNGEAFLYRATKTLATGRIPGYRPGSTVRLRVSARGNTISVSANGTRVLHYDDATGAFPYGQIGLATSGARATFGPVRIEPRP